MSDVTRLLDAAAAGDSKAAADLLPLVYEELRKLAAARMVQEKADQTLQPTALVHEAYLRLLGEGDRSAPGWNGRGHFFAAAAEAMRRILVDNARRKRAEKHGGGHRRVEIPDEIMAPAPNEELLALDEALARLELHDATAAQLVKLRYFAGLSHQQAAEAMGISRGAADRLWALARAWLVRRMST